MKRSLLCRLATYGTALLLSSLTVFPAFAANLSGHLDSVTANTITGWAWNADAPDEHVTIELSISGVEDPGANTLVTFPALLPREDLKIALGSANHSFVYEIDWSKLSGDTFTVTASAISGTEKIPLIGFYTFTKEPVIGSPITIISDETTTPAVETATPAAKELPEDLISLGPGYAGNPPASVSPADQASKSSNGPGADTTVKYATAEPGEYLGEFRASGYCNCEKCSGGYSKTYSGTVPQANHTIAADLDVFPIGTELVIDGVVYTVEDKGGGVNGNRLDIYFASHAEALAFGMQTVEVYTPK